PHEHGAGAAPISIAPSDVVGRRSLDLVADWTRLGVTEKSVTTIIDPTLRARMRAAIWVSSASVRNSALQLELTHQRTIVPICCSVEVQEGDRTWKSDRPLVLMGTSNWEVEKFVVPVPGMNSSQLDVVLRPNTEAASQTLDVDKIWGEDIRIKGVPAPR